MKNFRLTLFLTFWLILMSCSNVFGFIVDFSGGVVTLSDSSTAITDDLTNFFPAVSYEENGVVVEFIAPPGIFGNIGNYYSVGDAVVHSFHPFANAGSIRIRLANNQPFNLDSFDITSNTTTGGGLASGSENTIVTTSNGYSETLPPSNWGIAAGVVNYPLGIEFDNILYVDITSTNAFCVGLDNLSIEVASQASIPTLNEWGVAVMILLLMGSSFWMMKRKQVNVK